MSVLDVLSPVRRNSVLDLLSPLTRVRDLLSTLSDTEQAWHSARMRVLCSGALVLAGHAEEDQDKEDEEDQKQEGQEDGQERAPQRETKSQGQQGREQGQQGREAEDQEEDEEEDEQEVGQGLPLPIRRLHLPGGKTPEAAEHGRRPRQAMCESQL